MQSIIKLDYSDLNKKISEKEFSTISPNIPRILRLNNSILAVLLPLTTILVAYLLWSGFFINTNPVFILWSVMFYILVMGLPYIKKSLFKETSQNFKLKKFAKSNGLYYILIGGKQTAFDVNYDKLYSDDVSKQQGLLFNVSTNSTKTNVIGLTGKFTVFDYMFFNNYRPTKGGTKSRASHSWVVSRYTLSRKLPNIIIDNKANNFMHTSNLPFHYSSSQKISLEGNFDDYFTLYAPQDYNIDTLSFITPEVIEYIIQDFKEAVIEIVDNYLYVYYAGTSKKIGMENILKRLLRLAAEIEDNINAYRDSRLKLTATGSFDRVNISSTGLRLKRGRVISIWSIIGLIVAVALLFAYLYIMYLLK